MEADHPAGAAVEEARVVYERTAARLWRSLMAWSGSADVADEAVAEAFAQLIRRGSGVRDAEGWVWRAAYRIAGGELTRPSAAGDGAPEVVDVEDMSRVPLAAELIGLLTDLTAQQRACLVLRDIGGLSPPEVAAVLGTTSGTVRVQHLRARRRLRALLAANEEVGGDD